MLSLDTALIVLIYIAYMAAAVAGLGVLLWALWLWLSRPIKPVLRRYRWGKQRLARRRLRTTWSCSSVIVCPGRWSAWSRRRC